MKALMQGYVEGKKAEGVTMAKFYALCKQLGLNAKNLTEDEQKAMMKALEKSPILKRGGRRNK